MAARTSSPDACASGRAGGSRTIRSSLMRAGRQPSTRMRSASAAASSRSWVTSSPAVGRACHAFSNTSLLRSAIAGSSETNGSSSSTSSGSMAKARAIATRRAMPSDSLPGYASRNAARSSDSSSCLQQPASVVLCQQNILSHSTPGQQTRLLKDLADAWHRAAEPLNVRQRNRCRGLQ